ncbi:hypothetical protein K4L44_04045 [Halosquirtibacter laminarini]|uniref:Uncharacterized protein n=1 Tax=Halosquirtibacter laminarini TaxID=3374600 RepID=A0AC61NHJ1_9BACT|nr:hypothetical protein K4L44_04045 [Prolixibacteraceae bacterium]
MKLIPIFGEKLCAVEYPEDHEDIFTKIFESWVNPEYLEEFFENNKEDITKGYYIGYSVESAILKTYDLAE